MKKVTMSMALLLALALAIGTLGCGGNAEEDVRQAVEDQVAALNAIDFDTVYAQQTPSYRTRVTQEEMEAFLMAAYADLLPIVESGQAQVEMENLDITVEGEWAYVTGQLTLAGNVILEYDDDLPSIWRKIDGTWYDVEENPAFPGYDHSELPD